MFLWISGNVFSSLAEALLTKVEKRRNRNSGIPFFEGLCYNQ